MGDFDAAFQHALKTQSLALYGVGISFILLRLWARAQRLGGVTHYQIDDYLMMLAGGLYTALITCLNVITSGGGSNLYPPELTGTFSKEEVRERIYGSKIVVVSEQAMLNCIYTIKVCMLIYYTRLTLGLAQRKAVTYLAVYVGLGWLASETAFFTACRPFRGYWAMPPPSPQCSTLQYYAMVTGCFNISSDLLMLGIPIPLVLRSTIRWRQKLVLLLVFGMGTFVVVAALLTKVFNLTNIWDPSYMLWYTREASVAVYVSNVPMVWPLLRDWFPSLKGWYPTSFLSGSGSGSRAQGHRGGGGGGGLDEARGFAGPAARDGKARRSSHRCIPRQDSLSSLGSSWDVEMTIAAPSLSSTTSTTADSSAAADRKFARQSVVDLASSCYYSGKAAAAQAAEGEEKDHVVGKLGLERTIVMEMEDQKQHGEIQVERTIVIEERRVRGGDLVALDWERQEVMIRGADATGRL
ncbi:hypothetical protein F5Y15DRAFT_426260 [Xylariaceae sp. FL0016]|nr:hypothetical protein F5Y15DRAFT_426260 [Xylariaceae sp. FL0016]